MRRGRIGVVGAGAVLCAVTVSACGEKNQYVAPPPPKVTVAAPTKRPVTIYLEATGNAAAVNQANLVARVQGFVEAVNYQDGQTVKKDTILFTIEPETYKLKLDQARAAEASAEAAIKQAEADFERTATLSTREFATKQSLDAATANKAAAQAKLDQARADTRQATLNYGYAQVKAPFDGIVTARQVSVGELVGVTSPTVLATIVQPSPIYVNFNISERDVLRIRDQMARMGMTRDDLVKIPVEVGLQTDQGYPHKGHFDYGAPTLNSTTGTLTARAILDNAQRVLLPGYFARVRVPMEVVQDALLVPEAALGADQGGRYVLIVNKDNVVEQRKVELGPLLDNMRMIQKGIDAGDRVIVAGLLKAIPGEKVDPQTQAAAAEGAGKP
jgi:RND family efflux transporter MFP subunit